MNEHPEDEISLTWPEIGSTDDVVIIGGRGHGLSTAYHLATCHGITNVAVLEQNYIGGGNSGRNTTIIRANYGIPESVRFYQRSIDLYARLEEETGRSIMRSTKGLLWLAHTEAGVRREQARAAVNRAFGAETDFVSPAEIAQICPEIDLNAGDGQYPVLGTMFKPRRLATIGLFGVSLKVHNERASRSTSALKCLACKWKEIGLSVFRPIEARSLQSPSCVPSADTSPTSHR
jgi:L-2-hydroxyglutarate oxidase LhgO